MCATCGCGDARGASVERRHSAMHHGRGHGTPTIPSCLLRPPVPQREPRASWQSSTSCWPRTTPWPRATGGAWTSGQSLAPQPPERARRRQDHACSSAPSRALCARAHLRPGGRSGDQPRRRSGAGRRRPRRADQHRQRLPPRRRHGRGGPATSWRPPQGSLLFIENVGNLVCPSLFDLGERAKVVLLSVTEGEDKPLKYPHAFRAASVLVITKIDLLPHLRFDLDRCLHYARQVNPQAAASSASRPHRGDGMSAWCDWLRSGLDALTWRPPRASAAGGPAR